MAAMETSGDEDLSSTYAVPPPRPARQRGPSPATSAHASQQSSLNRRGAAMNSAISPSRVSPSRTCMTDTELLRSPTEVLYAVSDKQRERERAAAAHAHAQSSMASQTMQSELQNSKYHGGLHQGKSRSRATSREDLLYGGDNRSQYALSTRSAGPYGGRQQRNGGGGGDENGFKARDDIKLCCEIHLNLI